MKIIKAPEFISDDDFKRSIFLAGSIEMGTATNWQTIVEVGFKNIDGTILNPRRDDWDSSWKQSIENNQFKEQVEWELNALEKCSVILMNFDGNTKSPITLLELGLFARTGKLIVHCPNTFWRKGNVDIICEKYNVQTASNLLDLMNIAKTKLETI